MIPRTGQKVCRSKDANLVFLPLSLKEKKKGKRKSGIPGEICTEEEEKTISAFLLTNGTERYKMNTIHKKWSWGGVQFPTGGDGQTAAGSASEVRESQQCDRSGANPEPTVQSG